MSLWSLWFLITSTVIFIGFIESESPELPQERQVVAFFDRSSSFGKINRKGVFNFPFVCIQTPQKTVEKIRFELKTSEENLFVKTIKCAESTESKRHKLRVKLPAGYIFNYDYYQEWMIFEDSISAVLSVTFKNQLALVKQDSIKILLKPVYQRPFRPPDECLTFFGRLLLSEDRATIPSCPLDNDVIEMIGNRPVVFTAKHFGVVKKLPVVGNPKLVADFAERNNLLSELSVSFDIYLLGYPGRGLLQSIFHQMTIGGFIRSSAPLVFLEPNGDVRVEILQARGQTQSFIAHTNLRLSSWYHLTLTIDARAVGTLYVCKYDQPENSPLKKCLEYVFQFKQAMQYNPYVNSFVVGGSMKHQSVSGFICNFNVHLNRIVTVPKRRTKQSEIMTQLVDLEIAKFDTHCLTFLDKG
ncbi:protein sel-1 homolog 3-like [Symsagittifera roscoffensis]|uniref:protein sel-1 homolog 3-like n=1 Tax=Symsagittifera roscoffensis TaxID=84072 RepID=UPI00307BAB8A